MRTLHLRIETPVPGDPSAPWQPSSADAAALDHAAAILRSGGTVAMPTETVYGLAANALDPAAIEKIFLAKQRPHWDPLIVHVADEAMTHTIAAEIPPAAAHLMRSFWPGPLTLLLPRSELVPDAVTAARPLVGVRMPQHPVALALIRRAGIPLAAPSANRFGHISPTTAAHVLADLDGRIDAVLDAGPTARGLESTVLDPIQDPLMLYRPGAIARELLAAALTPLGLEIREWNPPASDAAKQENAKPEALPSPGVGIRHYAPRARLILIPAHTDAIAAAIGAIAADESPVGLLLPQNLPGPALAPLPSSVMIFPWADWLDPASLATALYAGLRHLDAAGCVVILAPTPEATGIGAAILDRLRKAAIPA